MTSISTFLDECRDVARLRHLAYSTEQSYVATIRRFIYFHERQHPTKLGVEEIRAYLTHLAVEGNVAASTQNAALAALLFLYRNVLKVELPHIHDVERARRSKRLPTVFTREEVTAIRGEMAELYYRASPVISAPIHCGNHEALVVSQKRIFSTSGPSRTVRCSSPETCARSRCSNSQSESPDLVTSFAKRQIWHGGQASFFEVQ